MTGAAETAIDNWELEITELRHETFEDEDAWVMQLDGQLRHLMDSVEDSGAPITGGARERFDDLKEQWQGLRESLEAELAPQLEAINSWALDQGIPHISSPQL